MAVRLISRLPVIILGLCDTKGLSLVGKHMLHVKQSKHEGAGRLQGSNMA